MKRIQVLSPVASRLHELHEFKLPFVSLIEFIRSKRIVFLLVYPGGPRPAGRRPALHCTGVHGRRHEFFNGGRLVGSVAKTPTYPKIP